MDGAKHAAHELELYPTNGGGVEHSFPIYADAAWHERMMQSGPIAPGDAYTMQIHFHDPQVAYLRDETTEASGRIVIGGMTEHGQ
jgi:hypothetical protein